MAGALVVVPLLVPAFWATNILGRAMVYGIIALSLTFLAHYGGFISLAQMVVAGVAGYTLAVTAPDAIPANGVRLPYAAAVPLALAMATTAGLLIGAIAVRTREIYLLMITLAIAVGFYYFVQTNLEYLNGYEGIRNVLGPEIFGVPFRNTYLFYYVTLLTSLALYALVLYVAGSPFGLVLQGVRDNPRRAAALGYNVAMHRIGAFGFAGFVAGCGGVLSTIYNIGISPGQISTHATITILVMAVVGGLGHPIGAFAGALIYHPDRHVRRLDLRPRPFQYADRARVSGRGARLPGRCGRAGSAGKSTVRPIHEPAARNPQGWNGDSRR